MASKVGSIGSYEVRFLRLTSALLTTVGEFGRGDTSIQVTGLKSGHFYNVRVIATNAASFSTLGPLIRLRTNVAPAIDGNGVIARGERSSDDVPKDHEPASIRTTSSVVDSGLHVTNHQISREYNGVSHHAKRTTSGRRNSPVNHMTEHISDPANDTGTGNEDDVGENTQHLTKKLDSLRQEQLVVNAQVEEEEQEAQRSQGQLTAERDGLKQVLDEKDKLSSELRRQGTQLDRLNRTAQSRKAMKEKILNQKRAERQRMKDEITRWNSEILDMHRDTKSILQEKAVEVQAQHQKLARIRVGITEDQAIIKLLEESIRTKGIKIKDLESQREKSFTEQSTEERERTSIEDADQAWETMLLNAQAHNQVLWQQFQQVSSRYKPLFRESEADSIRPKPTTKKLKSVYLGGKHCIRETLLGLDLSHPMTTLLRLGPPSSGRQDTTIHERLIFLALQ